MSKKISYLTIVVIMMVCWVSCVTTKPMNVGDIKTASDRVLPIDWTTIDKVSQGELDFNYYKDYDISTIVSENKRMVSAWFWCWAIFTLLLCGATEVIQYIPKVGFIFKFLGKRLSSLALAVLGWFFIMWVMGGGYVFTTTITLLALITANLGWELLVNWLGKKVKNKILRHGK